LGKRVRAVAVADAPNQPRSFFDKLNSWAQSELKLPGLGYINYVPKRTEGTTVVWKVDDADWDPPKGPIAKFLSADAHTDLLKLSLSSIQNRSGHRRTCSGDPSVVDARDKPGHDGKLNSNPSPASVSVFFVCEAADTIARLMGTLRTRLATDLNLIDENQFKFCWIVDFPMYEWNGDEKKIDFSHNPFSMPNFDHGKFLALDKADKETILGITAFQYDIVCNGVELSSGAIRNHKPDIMLKAFEIAGYGADVVEAKFGGMLNAFRYGAPPHGGSAPGVDRIVMLLAGVENLREVIAFPLNQQAQDLMMQAPNEVTEMQLKELHIRVVPPIVEKKG
jgi:aspartyl-tRNA synthetase